LLTKFPTREFVLSERSESKDLTSFVASAYAGKRERLADQRGQSNMGHSLPSDETPPEDRGKQGKKPVLPLHPC
jgi:hypothetical protein